MEVNNQHGGYKIKYGVTLIELGWLNNVIWRVYIEKKGDILKSNESCIVNTIC
jgi:hypothetical protein